MDDRIEELNQLVRRASMIISNITGYTSVVMTPQLSRAIIKSIQLVSVDEKRILVVVVAGGGIVQNKLIKHDYLLDENLFVQLTQALNVIISGKTIDQVTMPMVLELQQSIKVPSDLIFSILEAVEECVRKIETSDVYLDGITNILNYPEFNDLFKAREVLDLLKEEEVITALVKSAVTKQQFDFKIGSENEINQMKDLSIITTVYGREGKDLGAIGVIGPTRMAYGKVVSSIQYIRGLLNREIIRLFGDDP